MRWRAKVLIVINGITAKIGMLHFFLINSVLLYLLGVWINQKIKKFTHQYINLLERQDLPTELYYDVH